MKRETKKNRFLIGLFISLYVVYAVCLFWFHPFVVSAKESVPGGSGNTVQFTATEYHKKGSYSKVEHAGTIQVKDDYEIVAYINPSGAGDRYTEYLSLVVIKNGFISSIVPSDLKDCTGFIEYYNGDNLANSIAYSMSYLPNSFLYFSNIEGEEGQVSISGAKLFENYEALEAYVKNGSLDGMVKEPVLDKQWYLKDVNYKVDADDSPTSEAGEDATYITFTWSTDNLQDGDLLEIKTYNVLKKIGGDQISGFHDYLTKNNNVSAFYGKYRFSQYEATKAWFAILENKPLMFKSYDTYTYYLRPYRNGKYGGWVKISMKRATPTSSPYIEDIEYGDFDDDGDWITDEDLTEENGGNHGIDQNGNIFYPDANNPFEGTNLAGIFKYFFNFMKSIPSLLGDLPALVSSICSFLPAWVIGFIALGVVVAIILRVVGR